MEVGGGGGREWWRRKGGDTVQQQYYQLINGQYHTLPLISSDVELSIRTAFPIASCCSRMSSPKCVLGPST